MTGDELKTQMDVVVGQARVAVELGSALELDELVSTFDRAVDFGPFLDPTAWMHGGRERAERSARLVRAYAAWVAAARTILTEAIATSTPADE
jgi:hypothetical protein